MSLRDLAEFEVRNRLLAVPGVAAVETLGGHLRQFQVQLDPDRMAARGVSLDEVFHALEGANENAAAGFLVRGATEWPVRAVGRASGVEDLRQTVVTSRGAAPVLLGDVADVRRGPGPPAGPRPPARGRGRELPDQQAVRRGHGRRGRGRARGHRLHPDGLPRGGHAPHRLRPVRARGPGPGRRGPRGAPRRVLRRGRALRPPRQRARRAPRDPDHPALGRPRRHLPGARGRGHQHDDPRRARDRGRAARRRRDHRDRERPAPRRGRPAGERGPRRARRRRSRWAGRSPSRPRSSSRCSFRSSA